MFTQGVHWISKILRRNFSHIYLITKDDYNWIVINPTRHRLCVEIPSLTIHDDLPRMLRGTFDAVLHIKFAERDTMQRYGFIGMTNCVTWAKYVLGLPVRAFTPYALYRKLINFDSIEQARLGIISIKRI